MGSKMDALLKEMNKKAKDEILSQGLGRYEYEKIPFTSPRMNYCTFGGIPVGKLIEFYGEEHGGKTTTALDVVANFQEMERRKAEDDTTYVEKTVLYCDIENALDVEWAEKLGVDIDSMYVLQPKGQSAEQIFDFILSCIETGEIGLFVIDSLGAMISQQAYEKDVAEKTYAGISMALTTFSKKAEMLMSKYKCTGIGINQVRDDLNSQWGGYTTPGGKAWKHLCMVRLQFTRGKFFDENGKDLTRGAETPAGNYVEMAITKIKSCPPTRRKGSYKLRYDIGIDYVADLIDVATRVGAIVQEGSWYKIKNSDGEEVCEKCHGVGEVYNILCEDKEVREMVEQLVEEKIV